jgi:heme/copper-type cytochrome/quinol oxidase subunit 2
MKFRFLFACYLVIAGALFWTHGVVQTVPAQPSTAPEGAPVIEVTAKKYEFDPSPIRVKQGAKVQLKITATDHAHGFKINPFPAGAAASGTPRFVAQTMGTYPFRCCTVSGWHHRATRGELIVEP